MVEPHPSKVVVVSSNLITRFAQVAQSVEHVLGKDEVMGSNPILGFVDITVERAYA